MSDLKCPICKSENIETTSHIKFKEGLFYHRCKNARQHPNIDEEYASYYGWVGEKYQHDKYPEANLDFAKDIYCSCCGRYEGAYISRHARFSDDQLGFRCAYCGKVWFMEKC